MAMKLTYLIISQNNLSKNEIIYIFYNIIYKYEPIKVRIANIRSALAILYSHHLWIVFIDDKKYLVRVICLYLITKQQNVDILIWSRTLNHN